MSNPPNCHPPRERAAATAYRGGAMTMDGGRRRRASTAGGGIVPAAAAIPTPPPSPCRAREAAVTTVEAASLPASFRVTSPSTSKQLDGGPRRRSPVAEAPPQPSRRSRSWTAHTHEKRKAGSVHGKVSRYWTQTGSYPTKYSMKSVEFWCPRCRTSTLLRARHRRAALPPHPTLRALTTRGAAAAVAAPPPCGSTRRRWQEQ